MIDYELKPEINTFETQRMVFEAARDFAAQFIQPNIMEWDEAQYFPKEIFRKGRCSWVYGNDNSRSLWRFGNGVS